MRASKPPNLQLQLAPETPGAERSATQRSGYCPAAAARLGCRMATRLNGGDSEASHAAASDSYSTDVRRTATSVTAALTELQAQLEWRSAHSTVELLSNTTYGADYAQLVNEMSSGKSTSEAMPSSSFSALEDVLMTPVSPRTVRRPPPLPVGASPTNGKMHRQAASRHTPGNKTMTGYDTANSNVVFTHHKPPPLLLPTSAALAAARDSTNLREMLTKCVQQLRSTQDQLHMVTVERDGLLEMLLAMQVENGALSRSRNPASHPPPPSPLTPQSPASSNSGGAPSPRHARIVLSKAEVSGLSTRLYGDALSRRDRERQVEEEVGQQIRANAALTSRPAFSSAEEMAQATERMAQDVELRRRHQEEVEKQRDAQERAMRFIGRRSQMAEGERRRSFDRLYESAMRTKERQREAEERRTREFDDMYHNAVADRARMIREHDPNFRRPTHRPPPVRQVASATPPKVTGKDKGAVDARTPEDPDAVTAAAESASQSPGPTAAPPSPTSEGEAL